MLKSKTNLDFSKPISSCSGSDDYLIKLERQINNLKEIDEDFCVEKRGINKDIDIKYFESERDIYKIHKDIAKLSKFHHELDELFYNKQSSFPSLDEQNFKEIDIDNNYLDKMNEP